MSLVERCGHCGELEPRCRCPANPNALLRPGGLEPFEVIEREAYLKAHARFLETRRWGAYA